jgi:hypothetical protein
VCGTRQWVYVLLYVEILTQLLSVLSGGKGESQAQVLEVQGARR